MVKIRPLERLDAAVRIPGSKSYSQRAMVIAALAEGESRLREVLLAEDTRILSESLGLLGATIRTEGGDMIVQGTGGKLRRPRREIHLGNNGTAARLLSAVACLSPGPVVLTGTPRLQERPLKPLLEALASLGAEIVARGKPGYLPITLKSGRLKGGEAVLHDIDSSQYVSALLITAPFASEDTTIALTGSIPSLPYIALTLDVMKAFGVEVQVGPRGRYTVKKGQRYRGVDYRVEGDVSSASYFFLASALLRGAIRVENINPLTDQGDIAFLTLLERLGCRVLRGEDYVEIAGGVLPGGEMGFDLGFMPDMVPTLAVLAALRPGRTTIHNVAHLRLKESDRLASLVNELRKTGIAAEETADGIAIAGGRPRGAEIATYNDHRIAMSFAILGLVVPGMSIAGEECVEKSFPGFWNALEGLHPDTRSSPVQTTAALANDKKHSGKGKR